MNWSVEEIERACGGKSHGDKTVVVHGVSTDTRTLERGQLFVAITGENFDGHDFLQEAARRGAAALLVSTPDSSPPEVPSIQVEDTVAALGSLAHARRMMFAGPVLAITGSNGKTTTKEMCASILAAANLRVHRSPGNLNNHIGLPLSLLGLRDNDQICVLEMGMNHAGEIANLAKIATPDAGAITQISPAHLGPLGSIDAIAQAKGELFDHIRPDGTAVINADDPRVCAQATRFVGRHLSFGLTQQADFHGHLEQESKRGSRFRLETSQGVESIQLGIPGRHLVEDALCAAALAWASGALGAEPLVAIRQGLESYEPLSGRLRVLNAPGGVCVIDDCYNANPQSVEAGLHTLLALHDRGRRIAVLGDMLELGSEAESMHADLGRLAAALGIDSLIGIGDLMSQAVRGAQAAGLSDAHCAPDVSTATRMVRERADEGATVLIKGSRSMRMERVVAELMEGD